MADNIKYIRWAAGLLKIITVFNVIVNMGIFIVSIFGGSINFLAPINIIINAFFTYTAARGLELLADIAYHLLIAWQQKATS